MQQEFEFYKGQNDHLLKYYSGNNKYDLEYIRNCFNIKVVTTNYDGYDNYGRATLKECIDYVRQLDEVSVDIETTKKFGGAVSSQEGLDPYTTEIVMFQVGDLNTQFVIDTRFVDIQELVELLPSKLVIGQNLKFEYKHILHNYGVRLERLYDTMIAESLLYIGHGLNVGLKHLNQRYLNIKVDKSVRMGFLTIKKRQYYDKEISYGAEDILYPILIKELQLDAAKIKDLKKCLDLEFNFIPVLGDMEYKGLGFDSKQWMELYHKNKIVFKDYEKRLDKWVVDRHLTPFINSQYDMFEPDKEIECTINWGSSTQVVELFKLLKICPIEKSKSTGKMAYTVEAKVVKNSFNGINKKASDSNKELISIYLKYKELEQSCTTFGELFLKNVNPITKRLHSNYKQIINTGRVSSSGPNLQNIPGSKEYRKCFNCGDTQVIINADYSGQESVVLANQSMDQNMIDFYLKGSGDLHTHVAQSMFRIINNDPDLVIPPKELPDGSDNPEFTSDHNAQRSAAKAINFKLAYGGSAFTLKDDFKVDEDTAQEFIDTYFDAFPGLRSFFAESKKIALKDGYIHIDKVVNRKFFFKDIDKLPIYKEEKDWKNFFSLKGKYERASVNYRIQGTAGSITKLAGTLFRRWILDNKLENYVFITNIIHDEINVESTIFHSKLAAKALEKCMEDAGKPWCTVVPLSAGAVISTYWTH